MKIHKVVDMRTGLIHPRRHWDGRFMGRKEATKTVANRAASLRIIGNAPVSIAMTVAVVTKWNEQATR